MSAGRGAKKKASERAGVPRVESGQPTCSDAVVRAVRRRTLAEFRAASPGSGPVAVAGVVASPRPCLAALFARPVPRVGKHPESGWRQAQRQRFRQMRGAPWPDAKAPVLRSFLGIGQKTATGAFVRRKIHHLVWGYSAKCHTFRRLIRPKTKPSRQFIGKPILWHELCEGWAERRANDGAHPEASNVGPFLGSAADSGFSGPFPRLWGPIQRDAFMG
jgi:hypothetical protein